MIIKIAGKRWRFLREPLRGDLGTCDPPETPNKAIVVKRSLKGETELDTILHELLHAAAWELLSETWVETTATELARILHKIGYRKVE